MYHIKLMQYNVDITWAVQQVNDTKSRV